jgi:hypothetical protein
MMRNFSEMSLRARQALEFSHDQDPLRTFSNELSNRARFIALAR